MKNPGEFKDAFKLFTNPSHPDALVTLKPGIRMLVVKLAANIIDFCNRYSLELGVSDSGPTQILCSFVNWADHGFMNATMAELDMLFGFAEVMVDEADKSMFRTILLMDRHEAVPIVVAALQKFQDLKTAICKKEQEKHGVNWGTATGFFQADWTVLNSKLLALLNPKPNPVLT